MIHFRFTCNNTRRGNHARRSMTIDTRSVRCLGALVALLPGAAFADAASEQSLPPVVVTATRTAQSSFEVPASIDVVALDDSGANMPGINPSEYLASIPGLLARDRQNYAQDEQISIRGFGARSTFGVRGVRLYTDGIPATMPDGQGQVSNFSLESADRIEVLRGPFSALYGNSSGGVIQIFTADGTDPPELRTGIYGGGYGTYRISLDSRVDNMDPKVILGFFTWSDDPAFVHREMDFEFSRWGNPSDPNNAQYVVQPFGLAGNLLRFQVPAGLNPSTYSFKWETNLISYLSMRGNYFAGSTNSAFSQWAFNNAARIPQARDENARINLWLYNGNPPLNGQETEIIINRFAFVPLHPASPTIISAPHLTNGQYQIQIKGETQVSYSIQARTNFNLSNWATLGLVSSPNGASAFLDTNAFRYGQRFYRVLIPPQ